MRRILKMSVDLSVLCSFSWGRSRLPTVLQGDTLFESFSPEPVVCSCVPEAQFHLHKILLLK